MTLEEIDINNKFSKIFHNYNKVRDLIIEIKEIIKDSNELASSIDSASYITMKNANYSIIEIDLPIKVPPKIMYGRSKKMK